LSKARVTVPAPDAAALAQQMTTLLPSAPTLDTTTTQLLQQCVSSMTDLGSAMATDSAKLKTMIDAYLAAKANQLSFAALYTREPQSVDYGSFKVLAAFDTSPQYSFNLNGQVDINRSE